MLTNTASLRRVSNELRPVSRAPTFAAQTLNRPTSSLTASGDNSCKKALPSASSDFVSLPKFERQVLLQVKMEGSMTEGMATVCLLDLAVVNLCWRWSARKLESVEAGADPSSRCGALVTNHNRQSSFG